MAAAFAAEVLIFALSTINCIDSSWRDVALLDLVDDFLEMAWIRDESSWFRLEAARSRRICSGEDERGYLEGDDDRGE